MKTKFEEIYNELQGEYVGYIQISDKKLEKSFVYQKPQKLEPLNLANSFVVEACFFDGKESIHIRQVNNEYKVTKVNLDEISDNFKSIETFLSDGYGKVKIATIWEEQDDEFCNNYKVLKPTKQVFAGFKKGE